LYPQTRELVDGNMENIKKNPREEILKEINKGQAGTFQP
jgi:hypothetical protein